MNEHDDQLENGVLHIHIIDPTLRRLLALSSADLRFTDNLVNTVRSRVASENSSLPNSGDIIRLIHMTVCCFIFARQIGREATTGYEHSFGLTSWL